MEQDLRPTDATQQRKGLEIYIFLLHYSYNPAGKIAERLSGGVYF